MTNKTANFSPIPEEKLHTKKKLKINVSVLRDDSQSKPTLPPIPIKKIEEDLEILDNFQSNFEECNPEPQDYDSSVSPNTDNRAVQ